MKKSFYALLMFVALLTCQQTKAQDVVFSSNLATDFSSWTEEGTNVGKNVWKVDGDYAVAYGGDFWYTFSTILVSPKFTLDASGSEVTFNHKGWYFGTMSEEAVFQIREVGGEWIKLEGVQYPEDGNYNEINAGNLAIPAELNGKEVQLGFNYTFNVDSPNYGGYWSVKDVTVTKAGGSTPDVELAMGEIYNENFDGGYETLGFTVEGEQGELDAKMPLWYQDGEYISAFAYNRIGYRKDIESYLVSPAIKLYTENSVEFIHKGFYFQDMVNEIAMCVREVGGEWVNLAPLNCSEEYVDLPSGVLTVPAEFDGKNVQFGFKYMAQNSSNSGKWLIKNLVVKGMMPKKADAALSWGVEEINYELGGEASFESPVLSNPNNLDVVYSSSNPTVATVSDGGIIEIVGQGTTVIKAVSKETKEFSAGLAELTLNVIDKTIVFSANFYDGDCGFTQEYEGADFGVWVYDDYMTAMKADAYDYAFTDLCIFYLVSPEFKLSEAGNTVSIEHLWMYFNNPEEEAKVVIREAGTSVWENVEINYGMDEEKFLSENTKIPAKFNGKNVQIALKYTADPTLCGAWYVYNICVNREEVSTGIDSIGAEVQNNKVYDLQGRRVDNPSKGIYIVNGKKIVVR